MAQCWYSCDVRKWKIWGAALLIPATDAVIWLRTAVLLGGWKGDLGMECGDGGCCLVSQPISDCGAVSSSVTSSMSLPSQFATLQFLRGDAKSPGFPFKFLLVRNKQKLKAK